MMAVAMQYGSMQIDSMDNSKSIIPRIIEKSKGMTLAYRLPTKITGTLVQSCGPHS